MKKAVIVAFDQFTDIDVFLPAARNTCIRY